MTEYMNLKEKCYNTLKLNIITLKYLPGIHLEEKELAKALNVSRTPLREAFYKLENEGWIEIFPRQGVFVSSIKPNIIKDIYEARKNLEPEILKMGFKNLSYINLKIFEEKIIESHNLSDEEFDKLDSDLHLYIINTSNNYFIKKIMANIFEHSMRIRNLSKNKKLTERKEESQKEHLKFIRYLLNDDIEKAQEILKIHIDNALFYYLKILF